jgi:RimJ/RimL family protein N-acetyltransferase
MADIRLLQPGDEAALEAFLLPRVESSMFLIGNLRFSGLVDRGQPYEGTYVAAFENDDVVGAVAHFWNGNLAFQAPVHLAALWQAAVQASGRPIHGLLGPNGQVGAVHRALDLHGAQIQVDEVENLYSLNLADLVVPEPLRSGRVTGRLVEPRDLALLTEWRVGFSTESLGEEDGPDLQARSRIAAERVIRERRCWLLEDGDRPVSTSAFNTSFEEAVQVGGVWTPPELRRRGYARAVVAASLLDARAQGVGKGVLFTGLDNIPAQKAYLALGFRHIGDYRLTLLRSPVDI